MNLQLQDYARKEIKAGLLLLPDSWQDTFKLMYGRNNGKRSVEDAKLMTVDDIVDSIPEEKLDWAMQQIQNSIKKLKEAT